MTNIEWTEKTWNPVVGCSIVSPGCTNCYAMSMAARIERMSPQLEHYRGLTKQVNGNVVWTGKLALAPEKTLLEPLRRRKPTMWFANSMSDLFHEDVPDEWIDRVFAVMALCPRHVFQVLTKRPHRMKLYVSDPRKRDLVARAIGRIGDRFRGTHLAAGKARRQSDQELRCAPMSSGESRIFAASGLSVGCDNDCREKDGSGGSPGRVGALQRADPCRDDHQSPERQQGRQSAPEPRVGDDVRAASSCREYFERRPQQTKGHPEPESSGYRGPGHRDTSSAVNGDVVEGDCRAIWDGPPRDFEDLHAQDLAAHLSWPLPNVWLGVSAERQQEADERIPDLLATPAAVRFVSAEPLLGPVDFSDWLGDIPMHEEERVGWANEEPTPLRDHPWRARGIDWIIVGSESGRGARPCELDWVRSIRDQCNASAVPFFWKQHAVNGRKLPIPELDGKQWTEFPQTTAPAAPTEARDDQLP